ncbi:hypothetical protein sos41_03050 [Alphaproteobacteria bacterium SO-S41]|nr:hypothetical protein sos41_03050 [Alphaproteobacteria bacterium SO-S41]
MEIFTTNGQAVRYTPSPSVTAFAGERPVGVDGSSGASSEVNAQRKAAADASAFVAAQKTNVANGILAAEGAVAGTSVDIRV